MSMAFPRPIVVASQCLELDACRYDGRRVPLPFIERLKPFVRLIPVCPEVEIGLGTPREPIRIHFDGRRKTLYQPRTRRRLTRAMNAFSERFLGELKEVDGFILKSKSPSCALTDANIFSVPASDTQVVMGAGLFADRVLEKFCDRAMVDEARLNEPVSRAHFLTKIFTLAGFRQVKREGGDACLMRFHARNKLLFMAYDQAVMRAMGRTAANRERYAFGAVLSSYEDALSRLLSHPPTRASNVNAITHAMGHVSKKIASGEKERFLETLTEYRAGKTALDAAFDALQDWTTRFGSPYLKGQTLFMPYPRALCDAAEPGDTP